MRKLLLVLTWLCVAGCASEAKQTSVYYSDYVQASADYSEDVVFQSMDDTHESDPSLYQVWYGTNRKPIDPTDPSEGFSHLRDDRIHYGTCFVEVPRSHKFGSVGSSWYIRLLTWTDDRLRLESIDPMSQSAFLPSISSSLARRDAGKRTILVYIHGYNTTFEEAAIRAAQIGFDLKIEGVTAFFSWPSRGETYRYAADEATIQATEAQLSEFLDQLLTVSDADQVNILAHSMGNRALLRVVASMHARARAGEAKPFGQIVLAAPDLDVDVFKNLADAFPAVSDRTTLYVSSKDVALMGSGLVHDYPRAGFTPPVTVVDGIDTITVSDVDLSILGHTYYAEAEPVLLDIYQLLKSDAAPSTRLRLRPARNEENQPCWSLGR